jgi:hypothetical protein
MITGGVGKRETWRIDGEESYREEMAGPPKIATQITP